MKLYVLICLLQLLKYSNFGLIKLLTILIKLCTVGNDSQLPQSYFERIRHQLLIYVLEEPKLICSIRITHELMNLMTLNLISLLSVSAKIVSQDQLSLIFHRRNLTIIFGVYVSNLVAWYVRLY